MAPAGQPNLWRFDGSRRGLRAAVPHGRVTRANGFHEKASFVKVNVVTKASTIQDKTPFPRLPFALTRFGPAPAGRVHDGIRPGLRCCNLKCGLSFGPKPFAQSPRDTGCWAFPICVAAPLTFRS